VTRSTLQSQIALASCLYLHCKNGRRSNSSRRLRLSAFERSFTSTSPEGRGGRGCTTNRASTTTYGFLPSWSLECLSLEAFWRNCCRERATSTGSPERNRTTLICGDF